MLAQSSLDDLVSLPALSDICVRLPHKREVRFASKRRCRLERYFTAMGLIARALTLQSLSGLRLRLGGCVKVFEAVEKLPRRVEFALVDPGGGE